MRKAILWGKQGEAKDWQRAGRGAGSLTAQVFREWSELGCVVGVLDEHMRALMVKERPYKCELCAVRFTQSSSLNRHKKIHTGGFLSFVPLPALAPATAPSAVTLTSNMTFAFWTYSVNVPRRKSLFWLVRWFRSEEHRRALLAKERPYQCGVCYLRFTQKSSLGRHGKIHTGGSLPIHPASLSVTMPCLADRFDRFLLTNAT